MAFLDLLNQSARFVNGVVWGFLYVLDINVDPLFKLQNKKKDETT